MTLELKAITAAAIPGALAKAERYRLLNDPEGAESICLDVLAVEPAHQTALVILLLARTDQIAYSLGTGVAKAREVLPRLASPYDRAYYAGLIAERRAQAELRGSTLGTASVAGEWFTEAMASYEDAERLRPEGNDDALLRWNACARVLNEHPGLTARPAPGGEYEPVLGE